MTTQLVLAVDISADGKTLADHFRWCWLGADGSAKSDTSGSGDREALRAAVSGNTSDPRSAWLILPGSQVTTRQLEFSEKEKKHLRSLLPFQLEDSVVGEVEDLHFALATPVDGRVAVAYTDKIWLQAAFAELAALGIEITHCWAAPLLLPLKPDADAIGYNDWAVGLYDEQVHFRYSRHLGFSVEKKHARMALNMLLRAEKRVESLPNLHLYAPTETDLALLTEILPPEIHSAISGSQLVNHWELDFSNSSIDLCQGEFSQRLPIERWWKMWQSMAIFAGVCVLVYLGVLILDIYKLSGENLAIRQEIETSALTVVSKVRGDPEKQVSILLNGLKPISQSGSVMEILAVALPQIAGVPTVVVKGISYAADPGDVNINIQAESFSALETLTNNIKAQGLSAELLSVNAQGNVQSARLKINK